MPKLTRTRHYLVAASCASVIAALGNTAAAPAAVAASPGWVKTAHLAADRLRSVERAGTVSLGPDV